MGQKQIELFDEQEIQELKNFLEEIKSFVGEELQEEENTDEFQVIQVIIRKLEAMLKNTTNPNQLPLEQQVEMMGYITLLHEFLEYFAESGEDDEDEYEDEDDDIAFDDENIFSSR